MTFSADYRRRLAAVPPETFVPVMAGDLAAVLDAAEKALNAVASWSCYDSLNPKDVRHVNRALSDAMDALRPLFETPGGTR